MDLTTLDGKPFALLLMGTTQEGEDDWAVFRGIIHLERGHLYMERGTSRGSTSDRSGLTESSLQIRHSERRFWTLTTTCLCLSAIFPEQMTRRAFFKRA
jgi:hypothetical protein